MSAMYCPPALDDDDDDVSTTWVASNLPELTDPTALEISTLCGCFGADRVYPHRYDLSVSTCGRSFSHLHWLLVVCVMCLLRPILSFFRWGRTQGPYQCHGCRRRMFRLRTWQLLWSISSRRDQTLHQTSSARSCVTGFLAPRFRSAKRFSWPPTSVSTWVHRWRSGC